MCTEVKGSDSQPLFCSGETSPALLCLATGIPIKEDEDLLEQVFTEAFQDLKGATREPERDFLQCHVLTAQERMTLKRKRTSLNNKKKKSSLRES